MAYAGNSIRGEDQPVRTPELPLSLDRAESALGDLEDRVQVLCSCLDPVLRPEPPTAVGQDKVGKDGPASVYARRVNQVADRAAALSVALLNIQQRLEV